MVPPCVPSAVVEGVNHHVLTDHGKHHTLHRACELLDKVDTCHLHGKEFSPSICPSTMQVTGIAREKGREQRPSSVALHSGVAQS